MSPRLDTEAWDGVRGRREDRPWPFGVAVCVEEEDAEESDCAGEGERIGVEADEDEEYDGSGRVASMRDAVTASARSRRKDWTYCCAKQSAALSWSEQKKTYLADVRQEFPFVRQEVFCILPVLQSRKDMETIQLKHLRVPLRIVRIYLLSMFCQPILNHPSPNLWAIKLEATQYECDQYLGGEE